MNKHPIKLLARRASAPRLPAMPEIERFGAAGEEIIARKLCGHFDCVIRNVAVPHKELYLEKDFAVLCRGVIFVLEIKHWKGRIVCENGEFYQHKENGVRKSCKNPVAATRQFIRRMQEYYGIETPIVGAVVFSEPDCTVSLPEEADGIALLYAGELIPFIESAAKRLAVRDAPPPDPDRLLRCTRFYSGHSEFCKGILADTSLPLCRADGTPIRVDAMQLRYISVSRGILRDKVYLTRRDGKTAVYYNRDTRLTVACLDGSFCKLHLHRVRHIVL